MRALQDRRLGMAVQVAKSFPMAARSLDGMHPAQMLSRWCMWPEKALPSMARQQQAAMMDGGSGNHLSTPTSEERSLLRSSSGRQLAMQQQADAHTLLPTAGEAEPGSRSPCGMYAEGGGGWVD